MPKLKFNLTKLQQHERDPRELPAYSISEAAHYLEIPPATVRAWVNGTSYTNATGEKQVFRRVIDLPSQDSLLLSFFNLAEAHVLRGLRTQHNIRLEDIRKALALVKRKFGWQRPLIQQEFQTDGVGLFVEKLGKLIDATSEGQLVMREVLQSHLERIDWEDDLASRLYPFTRPLEKDSPKSIFIDPRYSFGKPVLVQCGIPTSVIAERYKAGDSIDHLARDYGCPRLQIEEGLRCELTLRIAA